MWANDCFHVLMRTYYEKLAFFCQSNNWETVCFSRTALSFCRGQCLAKSWRMPDMDWSLGAESWCFDRLANQKTWEQRNSWTNSCAVIAARNILLYLYPRKKRQQVRHRYAGLKEWCMEERNFGSGTRRDHSPRGKTERTQDVLHCGTRTATEHELSVRTEVGTPEAVRWWVYLGLFSVTDSSLPIVARHFFQGRVRDPAHVSVWWRLDDGEEGSQ